MPSPSLPGADHRPGPIARLIEAARTFDLARLHRLARRAWSRVLMSLCLAEARCRPASFRVRPPPALPIGHQSGVGADPSTGRPTPSLTWPTSSGCPGTHPGRLPTIAATTRQHCATPCQIRLIGRRHREPPGGDPACPKRKVRTIALDRDHLSRSGDRTDLGAFGPVALRPVRSAN